MVFSPVATVVCIYGQIFAPHGKYWDFHLTFFFFSYAGEVLLSALALCLRQVAMDTAAEKTLTPVQCQVLYIALCLCVGKAPLTVCESVQSLRGQHTLWVKC